MSGQIATAARLLSSVWLTLGVIVLLSFNFFYPLQTLQALCLQKTFLHLHSLHGLFADSDVYIRMKGALFRMCHAFYVLLQDVRQFEGIVGIYSNFWWPADVKVCVLSFKDKTKTRTKGQLLSNWSSSLNNIALKLKIYRTYQVLF